MKRFQSFENKYFSVFGDSISTLSLYSEPDFAAYYDGMHKFEANVFSPEDTWWGQVIDALGAELLVNNSFSGSTVTKHPSCMIPSYGCSTERTSALGKNGISPDVIMVFMGINDFGCNMRLYPQDPSQEEDLSIFSVAYSSMLESLRVNYPDAEIWCLTLPVGRCSSRKDFTFPRRSHGSNVEDYCQVIRESAEIFSCRVIDLHGSCLPYDTVDGFHPNSDGMKTISEVILASL